MNATWLRASPPAVAGSAQVCDFHSGAITGMDFAAPGVLVTGGADGTVRVWGHLGLTGGADTASGDPKAAAAGVCACPSTPSLLPSGKRRSALSSHSTPGLGGKAAAERWGRM